MAFEQGDILQIQDIHVPALVVSKNIFNKTEHAIVCPLYSEMPQSATHIVLDYEEHTWSVLCEQVRYLDLTHRYYQKKGSIRQDQIVEISYTIESLFDYY